MKTEQEMGTALAAISLSKHLVDHMAAKIRQTEIAARIAVDQSFMIEAPDVQQRRVQLVEMRATFHGGISSSSGGLEKLRFRTVLLSGITF